MPEHARNMPEADRNLFLMQTAPSLWQQLHPPSSSNPRALQARMVLPLGSMECMDRLSLPSFETAAIADLRRVS